MPYTRVPLKGYYKSTIKAPLKGSIRVLGLGFSGLYRGSEFRTSIGLEFRTCQTWLLAGHKTGKNKQKIPVNPTYGLGSWV